MTIWYFLMYLSSIFEGFFIFCNDTLYIPVTSVVRLIEATQCLGCSKPKSNTA